ncbi:MAG TPA: class I SAM-dependent methyltransferase [Bacteriovoracaceae bacterium]|nr:class I SAM-dependent methyltransferase [Bacteriovoracaceae bacterium]
MNFYSPELEQYCIDHSTKPGAVAKELENHTRSEVHGAQMLIGEMEGSILKLLIKMTKAKKIVEFGTFTGYSALVMAEALPDDGKIFTVDINAETTKLARSYWEKAGVSHKIEQILRPGLEALNELNDEYDLIFIDADKRSYPQYLLWATKHLKEGGIIVSDNTLWKGKVILPAEDTQTPFIQEHNTLAKSLEGFTKVLLPVRDGMYLIYRG